ncbi:hypothetical protein PLICRDRAFT_75629, partial [Plicaturopsis crispa FD-325 SS-3]
MLDFVSKLFVRMAPNATAWCDTLETVLDGRGFKLDTRNSIRRRFANALLWYGSLVNATHKATSIYLEECRAGVVEERISTRQGRGETSRRRKVSVEDVSSNASARTGDSAATDRPHTLSRPSQYLRERCPLCFGGSVCHDPNAVSDVIACLDACFTQKRRKNKDGHRDPPRAHVDSVFMPEDDVQAMRDFVEQTRGSSKTRPEPGSVNEGDRYEGNLRVPNSVLDECKDSFGAADEKREAASTQFFADTGLMGLLCRHDRVL